MTDLIRQYAIRKPDGELLHRPPSTASLFRLFGGEPEPSVPIIFDTFGEALEMLQSLQREALRRFGVSWHGTIEQRLCTPFSVTDPSAHLVSEIRQWMGDA